VEPKMRSERSLCVPADHLAYSQNFADPADVYAWPRRFLSTFSVVNDFYISEPSLIDNIVALIPVETKQCRLRVA